MAAEKSGANHSPCASRNIQLQNLLLLRDSLPLASLAFIFGAEVAASPVARGAGDRLPRVKLPSYLEHLLETCHDINRGIHYQSPIRTMALTRGALLGCGLLLPSLALAQAADNVLGAGEFDRFPFIQILQADFIILLIWAWWHASHSSHSPHGSHTSRTAHPKHMR